MAEVNSRIELKEYKELIKEQGRANLNFESR